MRVATVFLSLALAFGAMSEAMANNNPNRDFGRHVWAGHRAYGYAERIVPTRRHPRGFPQCWGGNCDPRWGHDHF
jgi:hypothetical protein